MKLLNMCVCRLKIEFWLAELREYRRVDVAVDVVQGGPKNVVSMFLHIVDQYFRPTGVTPPPVVETPATGCLHPDKPGTFFSSPKEYMSWYSKEGPLRNSRLPTVAILLYRKHVITKQLYIMQLIRYAMCGLQQRV